MHEISLMAAAVSVLFGHFVPSLLLRRFECLFLSLS